MKGEARKLRAGHGLMLHITDGTISVFNSETNTSIRWDNGDDKKILCPAALAPDNKKILFSRVVDMIAESHGLQQKVKLEDEFLMTYILVEKN